MPKSIRQHYHETFRLEVLRDCYSSGLSIIATSKKWGVSHPTTLLRWIKCHPIDSESLSLPAELLAEVQMKPPKKSREQLFEEEILRLKKALELEILRSHAFQKLIESAEKEEGISILKKRWCQTVTGLRQEFPCISVKTLCGLFGMSSQGYYKKKKTLVSRHQIKVSILSAVLYYRSKDPGIGGLKLHYELCSIYGGELIGGRDAFLNLLRSQHLMLPPKKPRHTTDSNHLYKKYPDLIKGITAQCPNHVWVSDITYIWIEGGVCYLHLITDLYSHAVLGWVLAPGLHAVYTVQALEQTIGKGGSGNLCGTIHHSDRGSQYACDAYIGVLMQHHIRISMTEALYRPIMRWPSA